MNKKISIPVVLVTALVMTLTSCADSSSYSNSKSASPSNADNAGGASYAAEAEEPYYSDDVNDAENDSANYPDKAQSVLANQKMVYTGSVSIETLEYDAAVSAVRGDVEKYGGFIENSSESNRNNKWYYDDQIYESDRTLSLTVRVPSEHFNEFLSGLDSYGQKMSESTNAENISRQYADNDAEIAALEKEQERLLQMMDAADTIQEMITVEDRLTEVQSQLNRYKSYKSSMDTDVQFSRITMTITEVHKYTPIQKEPEPEPTFLERLSEHVKESADSFLEVLEGLLFLFISLFPYLVIIAVIVIIVLSIRKKRREKILASMPPAPSQQTTPPPYVPSNRNNDEVKKE